MVVTHVNFSLNKMNTKFAAAPISSLFVYRAVCHLHVYYWTGENVRA